MKVVKGDKHYESRSLERFNCAFLWCGPFVNWSAGSREV